MDEVATTVAPLSTSSSMRTFTNWLGKRASSSFANTARALNMPVVGSIVLSMVVSVPEAILVVPVRSYASTLIVSLEAIRFCTAGMLSSGSPKMTVVGLTWVSTTRPFASPGVT